MRQTGSKFHWPSKSDIQTIRKDGILCNLKAAPRPCTVRERQFIIDDYDYIEALKEHLIHEE
jgi:hypothetical protein